MRVAHRHSRAIDAGTMNIGQLLAGRYMLEQQFGKGGAGTVYRSHDTRMDRAVAVKVFSPEALGDDVAAEQFATELRVFGQLEHPHILPIYDCGHDQNMPFLVMRFADQGSLADELAKGLPPLSRTAEVIEQVAKGMNYAHSQNMIHRDIKPQNVLVEATGDVYLADFSLAVLLSSSRLVQASGLTTGTAYYMSPEQCRGDALDIRADIYSLGAMLFEMCTGQRPYEGENWADIVVKIIDAEPPLPRHLNSDIPEAVQDVILTAMARQPHERYESALAMAFALHRCL